MALAVRRAGLGRRLVLPAASAGDASAAGVDGLRAAGSLADVWAAVSADGPLDVPSAPGAPAPGAPAGTPDLADVRGQLAARRALEIAAAGSHGLLLVGPPGTGKSMLARRLPGLLPPMTDDEAIESAAVRSLAGLATAAADWGARPFRAPHHSASGPALVGGGSAPRPGEISLAHRGVLFLDELPEFRRDVLETLREPLESGRVSISRAGRQAEFPAAFQLVAAMNPCPCGWLGHASGRCRCSTDEVARYRGRLSGPLLDRIDMHVEVPPLSRDELLAQPAGEPSAPVRGRVARARAVAVDRQRMPNAMLEAGALDRHAALDDAGRALLSTAIERLALSARAVPRLLRLARTIADLAGEPRVAAVHVAEAVGYRRFA
jgi:magnesium chelatase family protein